MAKGKYDKYFLKEPWGVIHPGTPPYAPVYLGLGQDYIDFVLDKIDELCYLSNSSTVQFYS